MKPLFKLVRQSLSPMVIASAGHLCVLNYLELVRYINLFHDLDHGSLSYNMLNY